MNPFTSTELLAGDIDVAVPALTLLHGLQSNPALASPAEDEDAALVRRCQDGDVDAFGLLVNRHEQRVRSIVSRILLSSTEPRATAIMTADIDDLCQDVFVQAWRALPRFRGDARFSTWLYRITVNRALKEYNHRRKGNGRVQGVPVSDDLLRHLAATRTDNDSAATDPLTLLQQRARDTALRDAIESLPEKQRLVVLLHYFEDCPCEEIAQIAGCSVGTVWSRLHYACRRLRESLGWMDPKQLY
jgi:RNA polymerase sigma-70 factor (ECF subfamily)